MLLWEMIEKCIPAYSVPEWRQTTFIENHDFSKSNKSLMYTFWSFKRSITCNLVIVWQGIFLPRHFLTKSFWFSLNSVKIFRENSNLFGRITIADTMWSWILLAIWNVQFRSELKFVKSFKGKNNHQYAFTFLTRPQVVTKKTIGSFCWQYRYFEHLTNLTNSTQLQKWKN